MPCTDRNGEAAEGKDYLMCVSPYPHVSKSPTNSCLYWIGRFADHRFDLENASGVRRILRYDLSSAVDAVESC